MSSESEKKLLKTIEKKIPELEIISKAEELNPYKTANPIIDDGAMPMAVAKPSDVEQLRNLIKVANEDGFCIVPVSSGAPHLKGGLKCLLPHILVDLSAWKKIPMIDRRNRVCMVEPGVTYGELLSALEPYGMTLSMPLAPRATKSVLSAVLDREPSTLPNKQWDISDPLASTEFVFGTGDVFRTGAAGGPGSLEKQRAVGGAQKSPMGPSQTDFHRVLQGSQGSMGIVTWATLRTELKPTSQEPLLACDDELEKLIPFAYEVQRPWLGEHSFILDRNALAMLMTHESPQDFQVVRASLKKFTCLQNIAGFERLPKERVEYQKADIMEIAEKNRIELTKICGEVSAEALLKKALTPCGNRDWRHSLKGHCLSIFFLTTLDKTPNFIALFEKITHKYGGSFGTYIQPVVQNHACHIEFMVPFNHLNSNEIKQMKKLEEEAVNELSQAGAFFSRPYGSAEKLPFKKNPLYTQLLKKIKDIFDPNGIFNPTKFSLSEEV